MYINKIKSAALSLLMVTTALGVSAVSLEARELRVSSFEPPQGFYSAKILQAWIDEISPKFTQGTKLRLYPGAILGAAPAQADLVKSGAADIALVVGTYTPGVFPYSSVVEVPEVVTSASVGAQILNTLYEDGTLAGELADYKVLALFSTPPYRFFTTNKPVVKPSDMAGLKMRTGSPYASEIVGMLGASGVAIPAPQVYENLERGVVNGVFWAMDAYKTFRLHEVAKSVTSLNLAAQPMLILMNKSAYEALPEADRKVFDDIAGRPMSEWIGQTVDATDAEIAATMAAEGNATFIELDDATLAEWKAAFEPAVAAWAKGQANPEEAAKVLEKARATAGH